MNRDMRRAVGIAAHPYFSTTPDVEHAERYLRGHVVACYLRGVNPSPEVEHAWARLTTYIYALKTGAAA